MKLNELKPAPGSRKRKKRVGRGPGGTDKTAGRGHKGQASRSGSSLGATGSYKAAGGQVPMIRRLPKRGFNHVGQKFHEINLAQLEERYQNGETVDAASLTETRLIKKVRYPIKLLGQGELKKSLKVSVHAASASAQEKVKGAGGTLALLGVTRAKAEVA